MSYYFNALMSYQPKLIDQKMQLMGLILLVFVSKNCQSGPLSSFAQHSRIIRKSKRPLCNKADQEGEILRNK